MRYLAIKFQLIMVAVLLFLTFSMMMSLVGRYNYRWDTTREKIYSLSDHTIKLLDQLQDGPLEVLAFYPHDDPVRNNFEMFLKECRMHHPNLKYQFYDPDRVPSLAHRFGVKDFYTLILKYKKEMERVVSPTEQNFTNALYRLAHPQKYNACFVIGHSESPLSEEGRNGLRNFRDVLENHNYSLHEIILARDKVPDFCQIVVVAGPHRDLGKEEFESLKAGIDRGKGVFFMIDPMDPGTGKSFRDFMKQFGILLGEDVIVDKMSKVVGGDFLIPLVSQYMTQHPITAQFHQPTFFPVARSVQPAMESEAGTEIVPLALTGSGSWAETNLATLEKGDAVFDAESDLAGPIPIAVAYEKTGDSKLSDPKIPHASGGRMVVVGDSDFITNAYLGLSGNTDFALNIIQWLSKDERFVNIPPREPEFQPLFLTQHQRFVLLVVTVVAIPALFFFAPAANVWHRRRSS